MKLGCFGCLVLIVALLVIVVVGSGVIFLSTNIFGAPDVQAGLVPGTMARRPAEALRGGLAPAQIGRARRDPIIITEPEVNAFLSRHLERPASLCRRSWSVRQRGIVAQGQTPLRNLLRALPWPTRPAICPTKGSRAGLGHRRGRSRSSGTGSTTPERRGHRFALGRQPLGSILLLLLMGPSGGGLLHWPVPARGGQDPGRGGSAHDHDP